MKLWKDVKIGDYVYFWTYNNPIPWQVYKITTGEKYIIYVKEFGYSENENDTIHNIIILNPILNSDTTKHKENQALYWTTESSKSLGKYFIHKKTKKEYEVISTKFKAKDIIHTESGSNGGLSYWEKTTYEWRNGLILYKALYENPDGIYFARIFDDFYNNFERIL